MFALARKIVRAVYAGALGSDAGTPDIMNRLDSEVQELIKNSDQGPAGFIDASQMTRVEKDWGHEIWITNGELYCGKKLFVANSKWCSYHHHKIKDEVLYLQSGKIKMTYDDQGSPVSIVMLPGTAFRVVPGVLHQFYGLEDSEIIEFSTEHFDSDSYRETRELVQP